VTDDAVIRCVVAACIAVAALVVPIHGRPVDEGLDDGLLRRREGLLVVEAVTEELPELLERHFDLGQ
jgi:hypothetical protein